MSDTPQETVEEATQRYLSALRAMQSGVAMRMNYDAASTEPKHLRVGVNTAHVASAAIVELLVEKGVITREEYLSKLADVMETERDSYRDWLQERIAPGLDNIRLA